MLLTAAVLLQHLQPKQALQWQWARLLCRSVYLKPSALLTTRPVHAAVLWLWVCHCQ